MAPPETRADNPRSRDVAPALRAKQFAALRKRIEHNAQYLTADDRAALAELLLRPPAPTPDAKTYGPEFSG